MPPKKRGRKAAGLPKLPVEEKQPEHANNDLAPPNEEERAAAVDPVPGQEIVAAVDPVPDQEIVAAVDPVPNQEIEPESEEAEGDAPTRKRAAPRLVTSFSEDEKELIIDFLQQNPTLYSKRLAGYKDSAAKDRLWTEQARKMERMPMELKTWYDSMRTKLGKLKKAVTKSGQAAEHFTATELWIWQRFQFLLEHITQMPRRTVASFTARLRPAADATIAPPVGASSEASEDDPTDTPTPPACNQMYTNTLSTAPGKTDRMMGLLETFLENRQGQALPTTACGSYVDGSLRSLPTRIRRTAEARIMAILHESQNEADRLLFRPVQLQQPGPANRQQPCTSYEEPPAQRFDSRSSESLVRQWQPPPSQWPVEVTNPPDLWHSMDRPWVQEQFPHMNIACQRPVTGNLQQSQQSTPATEVQDIAPNQMTASASGSFFSLLNQIRQAEDDDQCRPNQ